MIKIKLGQIIEDFDVYPRDAVNTQHVSAIAEAYAEGVELPQLVICKKTKVLVDGFHRRRALLRLYGEDHEEEVVAKTYRNRGQLILDACRYNASHGLRLDTHDKITFALKAEALGVSMAQVAGVLHMPVDKLASLRADRTAASTDSDLGVALKATIRHKHGSKLTKRQRAANEKLGGMNQAFYVNQIIELIESDLLDRGDDYLMERVVYLKKLLRTIN